MKRPGTATAPDPDRVGAQSVIAGMREAVAAGGRHWLHPLLEAIGRWPLAEERVGERTYRYLVAGEAFDWLLLAERLCDELEGLIPEDECEELLFHGRFPVNVSEEEFRRYLGAAKHRAHLNFLYGVRVEDALQLAVQEEVYKERLNRVWENGHVDDEACRRIYGATRPELLQAFRSEGARSGNGGTAPPAVNGLTVGELTEFTYWLFRYRLRQADPARVASDTRKGLAALARLEARRRQGAGAPGLR